MTEMCVCVSRDWAGATLSRLTGDGRHGGRAVSRRKDAVRRYVVRRSPLVALPARHSRRMERVSSSRLCHRQGETLNALKTYKYAEPIDAQTKTGEKTQPS